MRSFKRFGNIQKFRISRQKILTQGYSPAGFYTFSINRRHTFEFRRLFEEECPSEENVRSLIRIYMGAWLPSKPSRLQFIKITRPHKFTLKAFSTPKRKVKKYHHFTLQDTVKDPFFLKKCLIYFTLKNKMINPPFVVLTLPDVWRLLCA